jgi:hypothetical protein
MAKDADEFVQNCAACNLAAKPEFPIPMRSSALPQEPWEKLAMDFNGPHARLGGCSIFVMVDYFSRFVAAEMVKSTDMASIRGDNHALKPKTLSAQNSQKFSIGEIFLTFIIV